MKTIIILTTVLAIVIIVAQLIIKHIRKQQRIKYEQQLAQRREERKLFYQQECQKLINRFYSSYKKTTSATELNEQLHELYFLLDIYGSHTNNKAEWIRLFHQVAKEAHDWLELQQRDYLQAKL